jgi:hypothetical protein
MPAIKDPGQVAAKYARVTPQRSEDYLEGVRNPKVSWSTAAKAAEESYKAGVQAAATRGAFGKGVAKAGDEKWQRNAIAKGPGRFQEGTAAAAADYQAGFAPYAAVIASTQLPPRRPKGDPRNHDRSKQMADALRKKKMEIA